MDKNTENYSIEELKEFKKKSALRISLAVMLFIISPIPVILMQNELGVVFLLILVAIGVGLLIYNNMVIPKSLSLKEKSYENYKKEDPYRKSISTVLWCLITTIYLLVSFIYGIWHISWVIFIIGSAIEAIINAIFVIKEKNDNA